MTYIESLEKAEPAVLKVLLASLEKEGELDFSRADVIALFKTKL